MNEVTGSISRGAQRRVLAGILALATILRLFHLGSQSLWIDEMLTLIVATPKPGYPLGQLLVHNIHGPLHTAVVAVVRAMSEGEAWLRLPSAVAGIASVALLYLWVRPRFGWYIAAWSALLLAVNPLHLHYSQELRNYAFAVCFVLAACVQLDRVCARWSRGRAAAFSALAAASVLSNFSTCFVFPVQALALLRSSPRRLAVGRLAFVVAVIVLITSPWIYRVTTYVDFGKLATPVLPGELDESQRLRGDTTFRWESIPYAFYAYSVGFSLGPSLREMHDDLDAAVARHKVPVIWSAILFGTLGIAGAVQAFRRAVPSTRNGGTWRGSELLLYVAVPLVATLLLNWQNAKAFNVRYVLVALPMYLSVIALGIGGLRRHVPAVLAGAAVLATCAVSLGNYFMDPGRQKDDVRSATRAIEARIEPGECIFAPTVYEIVEHYQTIGRPVYRAYGSPASLTDRQLNELFASCSSFWYLRARPWVDDPDGHILSTIEANYRREDVMEFPGVTVLHFVPQD